MITSRLEWLRDGDGRALIRNGLRGIEKETLRVDTRGHVSQKPHPRALGSALTHPSITTDYSEALLELVTPPLATNWETVQQLCDIHSYVYSCLDCEWLWPMSMPCTVNATETIPIADYGTSNEGMLKTVYRRGLGHRYGRAMQAIAGVHFNYSPPSEFWVAYRGFCESRAPLSDFKSAQLMGMVRNYRRLAWLPTYLFGASPALCKSFQPRGSQLLESLHRSTWYAPYGTSLRMSDLGYQNKSQARLAISANSLAEYVEALTAAVTTVESAYEEIGVVVDGDYRQLNANLLQIENEYYSSIRAKPAKTGKRTTAGLREDGVEYVEVRNLDLNPADPVGINQSQLRVLEALLLYCLLAPSPPIDAIEQREIDARNLVVARQGREPGLMLDSGGRQAPLAELGHEIFESLSDIAFLLDEGDESYRESVSHYRASIDDPALTPSARILEELVDSGLEFLDYTLQIAHRHAEYFEALEFDCEKRNHFEQMAAESLSAQDRLESDDSVSFERYLEQYAARV